MKQIYQEILLQLEEKYRQAEGLLESSRQMKRAVESRNAEQLRQLLEQRQIGIDAIDRLDLSLGRLCGTLAPPSAHRALAILHRKTASVPAQMAEERLLCAAVHKIYAVFLRLRTLDRQIQVLSRGWLPALPAERQGSASFRSRV